MKDESCPECGILPGAEMVVERGEKPVMICGTAAGRRLAAQLIDEALAARERRKSQIAGDKVGYFIQYAGPPGMGTMHIEIAAPGIQSFKDLMGVQASLSKQLGGPALILNWRELDRGSSLIQATGPTPVANQ